MTEIILSFHNSCVRKSDINLLLTHSSDKWLNDVIIGFVFEYFEYNLFKKYSKFISFLDPSVAQFLKLSSENDLEILLNPLDLKSKELIFLPVNDHASISDSGGTHWSLAVFVKSNLTYNIYHYDSQHMVSGLSSNYCHAAKMSEKLLHYLTKDHVKTPNASDKKELHFITKSFRNGFIRTSPRLTKLNGESGTDSHFKLIEVTRCPQQINGYDCGVYCIAFAQIIAQSYIEYKISCASLESPKPKKEKLSERNKLFRKAKINLKHDSEEVTGTKLPTDLDEEEDLNHYLERGSALNFSKADRLSENTSSATSSATSLSDNDIQALSNIKNTALPPISSSFNDSPNFVLPYMQAPADNVVQMNIDTDNTKLIPQILLTKDVSGAIKPLESTHQSLNFIAPNVCKNITPEYISHKRLEIYETIIKLGQKGKK